MSKTTDNFSKLTYTADPYGYLRRKTSKVRIGNVALGNANPIRVLASTFTDTLDTVATAAYIKRLMNFGCEIVKVATPSIESVSSLNSIQMSLWSKKIQVSILADVNSNIDTALEAIEWFDALHITSNNLIPSQIEEKFAPLVRRCKELDRSLEIGPSLGTLENNPEKAVEAALDLAFIARKYDFHSIMFSFTGNTPTTLVQAYRLLSAKFYTLDWDYPILLKMTGEDSTKIGLIKNTAFIGSLLEDGIGDAIQVSLGGKPKSELELAFRIARRYTPIQPYLLKKAGVNHQLGDNNFDQMLPQMTVEDDTPVVVATSRTNPSTNKYHFLLDMKLSKLANNGLYQIASLPDYRDPYHYTRRQSSVVQVGNVKIGGDNPPAIIAMLNLESIKELATTKASIVPDIFVVNDFSDEVKQLRSEQIIKIPLISAVQSQEEVYRALEAGADGIMFCLDLVGQIGGELDELENILKALTNSSMPLFLTSTHNAGQSWGSYDYWPNFDEAKQLVEAVELCYRYNIVKLILGIYTYNSAWSIQNYRLLIALMQERGWKHPIHLIAPDIFTAVVKECLIDASISIGSLIVDGIGDSLQLDYLPKNDYFHQEPLTSPQKARLALNILQGFGFSKVG